MNNLTLEQQRINKLSELEEKYNLSVAKLHIVKVDKDKVVYIAILIGGLNEGSPKSFMDNVVSEYVAGRMYNEYVDANLDNPWLRIIIEDVNDLI